MRDTRGHVITSAEQACHDICISFSFEGYLATGALRFELYLLLVRPVYRNTQASEMMETVYFFFSYLPRKKAYMQGSRGLHNESNSGKQAFPSSRPLSRNLSANFNILCAHIAAESFSLQGKEGGTRTPLLSSLFILIISCLSSLPPILSLCRQVVF